MKQIKTYLNRLTTTNNLIVAQLFLYINTIYIKLKFKEVCMDGGANYPIGFNVFRPLECL